VATPEPTSAGRRGPELRNAWRRWSSTQQVDETRDHVPRGSTGAHLSNEVRSGAAGHLVAPKSTFTGSCDLKLQLTWQRVDTRPALYLYLELIYGGRCRQLLLAFLYRSLNPQLMEITMVFAPRCAKRTCKWIVSPTLPPSHVASLRVTTPSIESSQVLDPCAFVLEELFWTDGG
jgi:hypothetical protein